MTDYDPWDEAPASTDEASVTFKSPAGGNAWVTLRSSSVPGLAKLVSDFSDAGSEAFESGNIPLGIILVGENYAGLGNLAAPVSQGGLGATPAVAPTGFSAGPSEAPVAQPPAPQGGGRTHPNQPGPAPIGESGFPMQWVEGVSKRNNQPYKGWFSGQPQGTPDHLKDKPRFIR